MRHISKSFPGVKALDDVGFSVAEGEVRALVGENGAGKSTLMKILNGNYKKDEGQILIDGKEVDITDPLVAAAHGISIIFQELNLVDQLSIAENIFAGRLSKGLKRVNWKEINRKAKELLDRIGFDADPRTEVGSLTVAGKQMVEIAKALSRDCRIILMDEPSATLTKKELNALFDIIRDLKKRGIAVIYISHRMEEIFEICETATVMRDGRIIGTVNVGEVSPDRIVEMMLQAEMNFLLALLAAIAVGCACGAVTGFFVATFRLSPFIVSMTMQLAYKGIALTITNQTPVSVPHPVLQAINNIKLFNIFPIVFFFFLLLAVLTELFLRNTQFGRNLFLVGGNISVADNLGIKARNYIWSAYIFQGLFAAIGGVVMMTRQFSASGNLALQGPMEVIPMVIVGGTSMAGGRGGALKTVGGVVLLKIIYNAMTMFSIPAPLQPFVKGLILLVVIVSDKYMERRHEKV